MYLTDEVEYRVDCTTITGLYKGDGEGDGRGIGDDGDISAGDVIELLVNVGKVGTELIEDGLRNCLLPAVLSDLCVKTAMPSMPTPIVPATIRLV